MIIWVKNKCDVFAWWNILWWTSMTTTVCSLQPTTTNYTLKWCASLFVCFRPVLIAKNRPHHHSEYMWMRITNVTASNRHNNFFFVKNDACYVFLWNNTVTKKGWIINSVLTKWLWLWWKYVVRFPLWFPHPCSQIRFCRRKIKNYV